MLNTPWTSNGFAVYKTKSNFNIAVEMDTMQGDTLFLFSISILKRGFRFTYWFWNKDLPNFNWKLIKN